MYMLFYNLFSKSELQPQRAIISANIKKHFHGASQAKNMQKCELWKPSIVHIYLCTVNYTATATCKGFCCHKSRLTVC